MNIKDEYDFEFLVNEAERLVMQHLESLLENEFKSNVCTCQDCVLDMAAFALNSIPPRYRVSLMGTLYAQTLDDSDYSTEVAQAVRKAIIKISSNPAHD